jgi:hypothetical protein
LDDDGLHVELGGSLDSLDEIFGGDGGDRSLIGKQVDHGRRRGRGEAAGEEEKQEEEESPIHDGLLR